MNPNEFVSFKKAKPKLNKHIIVTNNLNAKDAHGEMSHVWMVTFWHKSQDNPEQGIVTFDEASRKIINLSHWKYA